MVLRSSIAKLLAESANTSVARPSRPPSLTADRVLAHVGESRGKRTEKAAAAWLERRGDRIVLTGFETPFAEIDILALRSCGRLLLCEVKSSFWPDGRGLGLGPRQRQRLARAAMWLASETSRDVEIVLLGPSTHSGQFEEVPIF